MTFTSFRYQLEAHRMGNDERPDGGGCCPLGPGCAQLALLTMQSNLLNRTRLSPVLNVAHLCESGRLPDLPHGMNVY